MIKIDFEFETDYGVFKDALHLSDDHAFSDVEIDEMKQQRLTTWLSIVNAPATETPPEFLPAPAPTVNINGAEYAILEGTPIAGQNLIEVNGTWYYKV